MSRMPAVLAGITVLSSTMYVASTAVSLNPAAARAFAAAGSVLLLGMLALTIRMDTRNRSLWPVYLGAGSACAVQITISINGPADSSHGFLACISLFAAVAGYTLAGIGIGRFFPGLSESEKPQESDSDVGGIEYRSTVNSLIRAQKMDGIARLAGGIAHDFNNMLSGILGYASLMRSLLSDDRVIPYISTIEEPAERGAALTRRLLEFAGRRSFELRTIDPTLLLSDTTTLMGREVGDDIKIETVIDSGLPNIEADSAQIAQAISDLCKNARESMPDGGTLRVTAVRKKVGSPLDMYIGGRVPPGEYLNITVADTGVGMSEDDLERVFEPFFTTKEPGCGSGLGLSSTLGIVKLHKGYVDINSEIGCGTRIDIYLPVSDRPVPRLTVPHKPKRNCAGAVLVVDDEDVIRRMAADILSRVGYSVILARNGSEGVRAYSEHLGGIDAVILDYKMPRMNGLEASRHIREIDPAAKILLSTGCGDKETVDTFPADTINDVLLKPFRFTELANAVGKLVDIQKAALQH